MYKGLVRITTSTHTMGVLEEADDGGASGVVAGELPLGCRRGIEHEHAFLARLTRRHTQRGERVLTTGMRAPVATRVRLHIAEGWMVVAVGTQRVTLAVRALTSEWRAD